MASTIRLSNVTVAPLPAGMVIPFAGTTAPAGYLVCDGSAISRTTFASLFNAIGTTHGIGDGSTTFNLPDYRGNFLRGAVPAALNSIAGSGTATTNNATFTAHGLNRTGIKVRLLSGTLSGLSTATTYYAIIVDANTLAFATTQANALAGTKISITGSNTGVIAQWEDPDASTRLASNVGGSSGSAVGSVQTESIGSHKHATDVTNTPGAGTSAYMTTGSVGQADYQGTGFKDYGIGIGNETRPKNAYVNYLIKV